MANITGKQAQEIVRLYVSNHSILETATLAGVSTVKVRRVLITEGLWESDTSRKIGALLLRGMTTEAIAQELLMSVKNVQAYSPYERGLYGGADISNEAVRSEKYRRRMKQAAAAQVVKKEHGTVNPGGDKLMEKKSEWKHGTSAVMRLHLELKMEYMTEEELRILKQYGAMKQSMSRDILVPADITLHSLHYAILRLFGWQNGHLHHFSLPEKVFAGLTENCLGTWAKLAGVYFRFPSENYEDLYWDDDYREGESFRSWLKKKYTGPYRYNGYSEHYLYSQKEVQELFLRWSTILSKDMTIDRLMDTFSDMICYELLERLPLKEVLYVKHTDVPDYEEIRKRLGERIHGKEVESLLREYDNKMFRSEKAEQEYLTGYDAPTLPVTEQLSYRYDYGDGWEVLISCEEIYKQDENDGWSALIGDVPEELIEELNMVVAKYRPVCVAKDGIELVDDVGGISGFCDMLQIIYGSSTESEWDEKNDMLAWANGMGWTGRKISPKQAL